MIFKTDKRGHLGFATKLAKLHLKSNYSIFMTDYKMYLKNLLYNRPDLGKQEVFVTVSFRVNF